jgi:dTDP-4-amino-4,6-dideoxygalactose transaminase
VYYPTPLPFQPIFAGLGHRPGDFPAAEQAAAQVLSLPLFAEITAGQIERVAEALGAALRGTA